MFVRSAQNLFRSVSRGSSFRTEIKCTVNVRRVHVRNRVGSSSPLTKSHFTNLLQLCRNGSQFQTVKAHCTAAAEEKVPYYINPEDFEAITNGDPSLKKKLQVLQLETEVWRQEGIKVPQHLTKSQWEELVHYETRTKRRKFLKYLWLIEVKKVNEKKKKEEKKRKYEELKEQQGPDTEENDSGQLQYGLAKNTIFHRMYDTTMNVFYNNNLIRAMQFGQPLVVDCGYDTEMTPRESYNCAFQLHLLFAENRLHPEPFNLFYCNADRSGMTLKKLYNYIPTMYDAHFPLNFTENSYLDMFPKSKLVYLTPHCNEELTHFDHDAVYIIGAIVDKVNVKPFSLAKAKREGIQMAKLPLDRHLFWGDGKKSLTLNQVISILLEVRMSGDWEKALSAHVPKRKIQDPRVVAETAMRRKAKEIKILDRRDRKWKESQSSNRQFSRF